MIFQAPLSIGKGLCLRQFRQPALQLMKRCVELLEFPQRLTVHGFFLPVMTTPPGGLSQE